MVDGGDALADEMKIDLIDERKGVSLKDNIALHEEFFSFLLDVE